MKKIDEIPFASSEEEQEIDIGFNRFEIVAYLISILLLIAVIVVAVWSGILLAMDKTEGGGPLGMLMEAFHIHSLL